jgi:hypothetical protein
LVGERKPAFVKELTNQLGCSIDLIHKVKINVMKVPQAQNFGKQKLNQEALRFADLDGQNFKRPLHKLVVLYNRSANIAAIILYFIVGGLSLLLLISSGGRPQSLLIAFVNCTILAIIIFFRMAAKRKSIVAFDANGITCADGRQLLWTNFKGKHIRLRRTQSGFKRIWRVEFIFSEGGEAWLIPLQLKNYDEVLSFVKPFPDAIAK